MKPMITAAIALSLAAALAGGAASQTAPTAQKVAPAQEEAAGRVSGQRKYSNIVLKRGASASEKAEQAAQELTAEKQEAQPRASRPSKIDSIGVKQK